MDKESVTNDLGTAYVRESGCGIMYVINLEDTDEEQFVVEMDREQLERLYQVCGKLLGKQEPPQQLGPFTVTVPPPTPQIPWSQTATWPWFGIYPPYTMCGW